MLARMAHDSRGRRRGGHASARSNADTIRIAGPQPGLVSRRVVAGREGVVSETLGFPIFIGLLHWVVVQTIASLAHHRGTLEESSAPQMYAGAPLSGIADLLVSPLRLWDGLWYSYIADSGYGSGMEAKAAFWPLFPWLMTLGHRLTGQPVEVIGYIVAHLCFLLALILLYRLVALEFDLPVARRTIVAIAFFPIALFFSAVYTESLFLLTVVGALLAARIGNWWVAGIVGALAGLTRSYGVLLLIPFAILFIQQRGWSPRRWFPDAIPAAMPLLGPGIFGWHLDRLYGNPMLFSDVQTQWNRYGSNPIETMDCAINGCFTLGRKWDHAEWGWVRTFLNSPTWTTLTSHDFRDTVGDSDTLELTATVLFLGLALIGLKMLPLYLSAFAIPGLIIPLYQPSQVHALMSMPRFGLTLFPLFIVLAILLRRRRLALPALTVSVVLLILLTAQFAQWYWVS